MKYTMDSLHQVETALSGIYRGAKMHNEQIIIAGDDMEFMATENERKAYFGAITAGDDTFIELFWRGKKIITIDSGSQIIMAFTQAVFVDNLGAPKAAEGQFRGATIQLDI